MKTRLLFLAAFAAAILLLASCEQAGGVPTSDEDTSSSPACEGKKADDPSCQTAPLQSDPADTTKGSQPDTEQPAPPPDCSKVTEPFPTGTWVMCDNTWNPCQIEWLYDPNWGCLASCWEVPGSPPPIFKEADPHNLSVLNCQPSP